MSNEIARLKCWRELPPEDQERVLEFATSLRTPAVASEFAPKTPLGEKLMEIRQQAVAQRMKLLTLDQIEQELADRRGGYRES